ncbi:phosphate ABC transporter substrate-binding protein PstS, partial [bacterium]|nr:phosphate ABC transporter substrate-binding protein PstS [bacterium]
PSQGAVKIEGAGASFPKPVYEKWIYEYNGLTGVQINYQSIGSGGGIANIKAKKVDFGASDNPLEEKELNKAGLLQFPMVMGGVVPIINLKGLKSGDLKLTPEILAGIFMGEIYKWNDKRISEINPNITLPNLDILVVHRADGSGTTFIFTNYLDKVSSVWHEKVGCGKEVNWPTGIGGKGNEGVANNVMQIEGAIGYVEFAYAKENDIPYTSLKNSSGSFVKPSIETFHAAAANADWEKAPGFYMLLTNQPGNESWPITGATYILIYKEQEKKDIALELLKYFDWCYKHGDKIATDLHYVPMPDNVVKMVQDDWSKEIKCKGEILWK